MKSSKPSSRPTKSSTRPTKSSERDTKRSSAYPSKSSERDTKRSSERDSKRSSAYPSKSSERDTKRSSERDSKRSSAYPSKSFERDAKRSSERDSKRSSAYPSKSFERDAKRPSAYPSKSSEHTSRNPSAQQAKFIKKPDLHVWGKRTVEAFLTSLSEKEAIKTSAYALHIIVDKSKKAPSQLKPAVEMAQQMGIKIYPHAHADELWPLGESDDLNHQRICLKIPEYPTHDISDALSSLRDAVAHGSHKCEGLVLDQVQDPRNFGAILRSAAFFGIPFVIYGTDRQAPVSATTLKASAGGAFSVKLIPVTNINRALTQLKDAGAWIAGTALDDTSIPLQDLPRERPWIVVMGNEGSGLRSEVAKKCDYLVQIPAANPHSTVDSLNVSVATGICLQVLSSS